MPRSQRWEYDPVPLQALRLLGIRDALYQHVLPAVVLPVPLSYAGHIIEIGPLRSPPCPHCNVEERLWLKFVNQGNFNGWNLGEGCCLVDGKLYSAWADRIVGETGGRVGTKTAVSAAHHILLQLDGGYNELQRWCKSYEIPCDNGDCVPVPSN